MFPTLKEFLAEASLGDISKKGADAIGGPVTKYPKTTIKRFMDQWNDHLGKWVRSGLKKGNLIKKRVNSNPDSPTVLDQVDEEGKLISTAVITLEDGQMSDRARFDYYNQTDHLQSNKYRVNPAEITYEPHYTWKEMSNDGASPYTTRNLPMSNRDVGNTGEIDDATKGASTLTAGDRDREDVSAEELGFDSEDEGVVTRRLPSRRGKPDDAAAAWGRLTKPKPGRKT